MKITKRPDRRHRKDEESTVYVDRHVFYQVLDYMAAERERDRIQTELDAVTAYMRKVES